MHRVDQVADHAAHNFEDMRDATARQELSNVVRSFQVISHLNVSLPARRGGRFQAHTLGLPHQFRDKFQSRKHCS